MTVSAGAAFGVVDVLADRPRSVCPDCGDLLAWEYAAARLIRDTYGPEDRQRFRQMADAGWVLYACPACKMAGGFSPPNFF